MSGWLEEEWKEGWKIGWEIGLWEGKMLFLIDHTVSCQSQGMDADEIAEFLGESKEQIQQILLAKEELGTDDREKILQKFRRE